jgi:hypothetical protein
MPSPFSSQSLGSREIASLAFRIWALSSGDTSAAKVKSPSIVTSVIDDVCVSSGMVVVSVSVVVSSIVVVSVSVVVSVWVSISVGSGVVF